MNDGRNKHGPPSSFASRGNTNRMDYGVARSALFQKDLVDLQADVKKVSSRLAESIAARNAATKNVISSAQRESSLLERIKALIA